MDEARAKIYDVIIIGAGPAGLTAAIYTSRARLKTLVIESPFTITQAAYADSIENYPGFPDGVNGIELVNKFKKQAEGFGAGFEAGDVKNMKSYKGKGGPIWQVGIDDKIYDTPSVIIASGAKAKELGVAGEERFRGKGISYCAICDGALFKGKDVVVVGDSNITAEETLFLTKFAKKVILIPQSDKLHVAEIFKEKIQASKCIELVLNTVVEEIKGKILVEAVKVRELITDKTKDMPCQGVFIFAGFKPSTDFVKGVIELDDKGYIAVDEAMRTSGEGIFACGDCRRKFLRQVVTACADGALAAYSCQQYLKKESGIK